MLRSFHYAAVSALVAGTLRPEDAAPLAPWARYWNLWTGVAFLDSYLAAAADGGFLPTESGGLELALRLFLLDKAFYELGYELNHRPSWVGIPLRGLRELSEGPLA
jgi:maltose alpha-D-glucosyltransferase/alpha-amylase